MISTLISNETGPHHIKSIGTEGRTRTGTVLPPPDFESGASTSFATPAKEATIIGGQGLRYKCHSEHTTNIIAKISQNNAEILYNDKEFSILLIQLADYCQLEGDKWIEASLNSLHSRTYVLVV